VESTARKKKKLISTNASFKLYLSLLVDDKADYSLSLTWDFAFLGFLPAGKSAWLVAWNWVESSLFYCFCFLSLSLSFSFRGDGVCFCFGCLFSR
jgi:hypothetical protein